MKIPLLQISNKNIDNNDIHILITFKSIIFDHLMHI